MSVSRPFLLVLIGVVLLGATFFAVQNAQQRGAAARLRRRGWRRRRQQPRSRARAAAVARAGARGGLHELTPRERPLRRSTLPFSAQGQTGTLELSGATDDSAKDAAPRPRRSSVERAGHEARGRLRHHGRQGLVHAIGDTGYLVPAGVWDEIVEAAARAARTPRAQPRPTRRSFRFDPAKWIADVSAEGSETIDGVETRHVSAASTRLPRPPTSGLGPPPAARQVAQPCRRTPCAQVEKGVKRADFDVWVGEKDKILRRLDASSVELAVPGAGPVKMSLALRARATWDEPQTIDGSGQGRATKLPGGELRPVHAHRLLGGLGGGRRRRPEPLRAGLQATTTRKKLERALAQSSARSCSSSRTRAGSTTRRVETLGPLGHATRRRPWCSPTSSRTSTATARWSRVSASTRRPAVVVIDSRGKARLIEGYVDASVAGPGSHGRAMSESPGRAGAAPGCTGWLPASAAAAERRAERAARPTG